MLTTSTCRVFIFSFNHQNLMRRWLRDRTFIFPGLMSLCEQKFLAIFSLALLTIAQRSPSVGRDIRRRRSRRQWGRWRWCVRQQLRKIYLWLQFSTETFEILVIGSIFFFFTFIGWNGRLWQIYQKYTFSYSIDTIISNFSHLVSIHKWLELPGPDILNFDCLLFLEVKIKSF